MAVVAAVVVFFLFVGGVGLFACTLVYVLVFLFCDILLLVHVFVSYLNNCTVHV